MNVHHENGRFFIDIDGKHAKLLYREENGKMDIYHTFTPPELRGRGIAEHLALAAFEFAQRHGMKIIPSCPYIKDTFLKKHAELRNIVEG